MDADQWLAQPVFDARIAAFTQRLLLQFATRLDVIYLAYLFGHKIFVYNY